MGTSATVRAMTWPRLVMPSTWRDGFGPGQAWAASLGVRWGSSVSWRHAEHLQDPLAKVQECPPSDW